jgi:hypothetical protein
MLKRFVLGATLLAVLVAPATAQSPLDWVPPPEAAQWAPGTTENLAMVRRLRPGLKGRELESAQRAIAIQMAMLTALVGRAEASIVERRWERRLNAMYDSRSVDQTLNHWGINPPFIERLARDGKSPSALNMIRMFIAQREEREGQVAQGRSEKRQSLRRLAQDTRDIFGEAASNAILTRDTEYMRQLELTLGEGGDAAGAARAKESDPSAREGK